MWWCHVLSYGNKKKLQHGVVNLCRVTRGRSYTQNEAGIKKVTIWGYFHSGDFESHHMGIFSQWGFWKFESHHVGIFSEWGFWKSPDGRWDFFNIGNFESHHMGIFSHGDFCSGINKKKHKLLYLIFGETDQRTQDESQWIVRQCPLSALTIPGCN